MDRIWSTEEIIENSHKWNLAGDVALLNSLKNFADKLLKRTSEINTNIIDITQSLDETSLNLHIAQNKFESLRNSQFIESRVYEDDDESITQAENIGNNPTNPVEIDRSDEIKLAALRGLQVLDRYFDKVAVSVSDSEDDDIDDLPNYVLRPKDLYIDRPLPYVIGSEEWLNSWHCGLEVSSSESETEDNKLSSEDSQSESETTEDNLSTQLKPNNSDSSSSDYYSYRNQNNETVVNNNFAEQLAAKLGQVIDEQSPQINTRPIQKPTVVPSHGLFFDEPPPIDEKEPFSTGVGGLFDDDDQEEEEDDDNFLTPKRPGLFADDVKSTGTANDDDLFTIVKEKSNPLPLPRKSLLLNEEPPALEDEENHKNEKSTEPIQKKKIDLFTDEDTDDIFIKTIQETKINKIDDLFNDTDEIFTSTVQGIDEAKKEIKNNLFEETDDDEIFSSSPKISKNKFNLFGDDEEKPSPNVKITNLFEDDDLFAPSPSKYQNSSQGGLFADDDNDDVDNIFNISHNNGLNRILDSPPPTEKLFENKLSDTELEPETSDDCDIFTDKEEKIDKIDLLFSDEPPPLPEETIKEEKIGKIKHNLNINVKALMPGFAPLKRTPHSVNNENVQNEEKPFGDSLDNVQVLQSITKDRARVPLKRRPSTRNGRKSVLHKSFHDFNLNLDEEVKIPEVIDDLPTKTKPKDLFDEDEADDDLFNIKKIQKTKPVVTQKSLFDDEDDDDDIFKSFPTKSSGAPIERKKLPPVKSNVKKLHNIEPEDDPLSALLK